MDDTRHLASARDIIQTIGKDRLVEITGRSSQSISNWKAVNRLPSDSFLIISAELKSQGYTAAPSCWGIREPEQANDEPVQVAS